MSTISPQRMMAAMSAVGQLKAELADRDDDMLLDVIASETDALELMDRLAEQAIADKKLAEMASERAKRLDERAKRHRDVIRAMLEAMEVSRVERALYTASTSQRQELVEVATNEELPSAFVRTSPDKVLIGKTLRKGNPVPGYAWQDKAELVLTLRSA